MSSELKQNLFPLEPQYRERVWGGQRLKAAEPPIGEAWIAFGESLVKAGAHAGQTVAELASLYGAQLLGAGVASRFGSRFPILIKLLDCADWLSVQVHPNDEQAERLVGPGHFGKTEAWHLLEVEEGATIYAGVNPGTTAHSLEAAIREGRILDVAKRFEVRAGETYLLPAGTLHALGPGLLLYEIQQASDTTYRVYDWGRPAAAGRSLHIEESIAVTDPLKAAVLMPPPALEGTSGGSAINCPYFQLHVLQIAGTPFVCDSQRDVFDILTVTCGSVEITCEGERARLGRFETVLVAATAGAYKISAADEAAARVLRATVPAAF